MKLSQRLINPVLEKEFRLRMRTLRSPLAILIYLAALGLLGFAFMYTMRYESNVFNPERSQQFFYFLTFTQLALISFMTPGLTAGAISGEREKQTLNMLLTTQQSSTTIILSKLLSSISFMLLIVIATLPLYSIVFLFGGISPWQVIAVFLFFVFIMCVLASFSIMFSTLFKRTMVSVITSYGLLLFIYGFTGLITVFIEVLTRRSGGDMLAFYVMSTNPAAALYSLLDRSFSQQLLFNGSVNVWHFWQIFIPVYTVLAILALLISIRYLRPVLRKRK